MMIRIAMLAFLFAVGCDSARPSCALSTGTGELMACIEYAGAISESEARTSCEGGGGTWQDAPCQEGAAARCTAFGSTTWYYAPYLVETGLALAELRATCEETGGEFEEY